MKAKAVDFVSFSVTDMDRAEAFYRDVLGLEVEVPRGEPGTRGNGYMELDAGGVAIGLVAMPQTHPNAIVALAVDHVGEAVEELRGNGVPIAMETIELYGRHRRSRREQGPAAPAEGRHVRVDRLISRH